MKRTEAPITGHAIIDAQHRELFRLLEDLGQATAEQRTMLAVYSITRLKHYVGECFEAEESLMKQCAFPKAREHIAEHHEFRAKVLELESQAIILDVSMEMLEFLAGWLADHIARFDMKFVRHLEKCQR